MTNLIISYVVNFLGENGELHIVFKLYVVHLEDYFVAITCLWIYVLCSINFSHAPKI